MQTTRRCALLRELGLTPTVQRLAVLEFLEGTSRHPTADIVLAEIQKRHPTISRATVYNTLDALTKAGVILRITIDPAVTRYDADLKPHAHFRCRTCGAVYDIRLERENTLGDVFQGHRIETVRTYAYGVCLQCLRKEGIASA
jgi:Fur family transcriptional regulator, peroxide stress response regulator